MSYWEGIIMKRKVIAGLFAGSMIVGGFGFGMSTASAAPIDCPSGQTATKTADGWDCQNRGGNTSNAEDPKNPNASKGDF
jgi:hypothetical protein